MLTTTQAPVKANVRRVGASVLRISTAAALLVGVALSFVNSDPTELPDLVVAESLGAASSSDSLASRQD